MKKTGVISFIVVLSMALAQCKTSANMAAKNEAAEKRVAALKANHTQVQIDEGKTISLNKCNKCHDYHQPTEFTAVKWEKILVEMTGKAKLNEKDADLVSAYILTNAKPYKN